MGSLDAAGIPVPGKTPVSFRKMDTRITKTDAENDIVEEITNNRPELNRTLGSGCIIQGVGASATAECTQTVVWGLYKAGNSTQQRIASDESASRSLNVASSGNTTVAVIETALQPDTPQLWAHHMGNTIVRKNSVTDAITDRASNSGSF